MGIHARLTLAGSFDAARALPMGWYAAVHASKVYARHPAHDAAGLRLAVDNGRSIVMFLVRFARLGVMRSNRGTLLMHSLAASRTLEHLLAAGDATTVLSWHSVTWAKVVRITSTPEA